MWRRLELDSQNDLALWTHLDQKLSDPERPKSIYSSPLWLTRPDRSELEHLAVYEGNGAVATLILGPTALPLYLGELAVGKLSFQRATLADFRFPTALGHPQDLLASMLRAAKKDLGGDVVFHMESHGLGFAREIGAYRRDGLGREFLWLDYGRQVRRFIRLRGSFEEYFAHLSSKARTNIKRGRARFAADLGGEPRLIRVTELDQVDSFLHNAEQVSKKTYQWHLLNSGLRNEERTRTSLRFAAEQGWLRSYLFCAGQEPIAFILGFQYAGTHQGSHHGYDPAYAKYSIGIQLWISALADLFNEHTPQWFDFGSGDALYKSVLANVATEGVRFYLWPRKLKSRVSIGAYGAVESLNRGGSRVAERLKLKSRVKRLFRKRAQRKEDEA